MKNNYVLIDYENVQPKNLDLLDKHDFQILVFVGANQNKIPFDLAASLQKLGTKAQYIKIGGTGKNSLDFHIAFYIGQLSQQDPDAYFHIISRDTGFDPLIAHLKQQKIFVQREANLSEIPVLRISNATSVDEKIDAIVKNLAGRGHSRPRKVKTLSNTINSLFLKSLEELELDSLLSELEKGGYITVNQTNVGYKLPTSTH